MGSDAVINRNESDVIRLGENSIQRRVMKQN